MEKKSKVRSKAITKKIHAEMKYEYGRGVKMYEVNAEMWEWAKWKRELRAKEVDGVHAKGLKWTPADDERLEKEIRDELLSRAKDNYVAWIRLCMGDDFIETPYHVYIAMMGQYAIKEAECGRDVNITISCPPQTGKSEMIAKHMLAWFLGRHPNCEAMLLTSDADLAKTFGDSNRQKAIEFWGSVFGIEVSKAFKSKTEIAVEGRSGVMRFKGVTGTVVGRGAVLNIIDDPYPSEEYVNSRTLRERLISLVRNDIFTRARGKGDIGCIRFVIHTRRHEEDLIGILDKEYITKEESPDGFARKKWFNITLPYFATDAHDLIGRKIGEPLAPKMGKDEKWGISKKSDVGARAWSAQYQQNPLLDNGAIFKKEWFKEYQDADLPMMFEQVILSCDLSNQASDKSDFAAFQVWAYDDGKFYLLGRGKKRCSFNEQISIIKTFLLKYPIIRSVLVEKKATGTAMIDFLQKNVNINVIGYDPKYQQKESRASAASVLFEAGRVFIPTEKKDPNIEYYKNELLGFPNMAHDDEVDATSQVLIYLSERKGGRVVSEKNKLFSSVSKYLRS